MEERELALRRVLSANIKKFRGRKAWSQMKLAEKLEISTNFLAGIETGKNWVSPLTLVKIAEALDIEVFELFQPPRESPDASPPGETVLLMKRFVSDLTIALDDSVREALRQSIAQVSRQYLP